MNTDPDDTAWVLASAGLVRILPFDPDAELARMREELIVEATHRTIQALEETDPLR